jgi:hypothetical protein
MIAADLLLLERVKVEFLLLTPLMLSLLLLPVCFLFFVVDLLVLQCGCVSGYCCSPASHGGSVGNCSCSLNAARTMSYSD